MITYGEVYEGLAVGAASPEGAERFARLLRGTRVLPIDREVAERWATIRQALRRRGELILDADMLIAATALHHNLTLVTRNVGHFARIDGLRLLR